MANVSAFTGAMPVIPGGTVELGYSQITSSVTVGTSVTNVTSTLTVVCDGGPILVEFFAPSVRCWLGGDNLTFSLFEDGVQKASPWGESVSQNDLQATPVQLQYRLTPSAGSHTYQVKAVASLSSSQQVRAGSGGTGSTSYSPAFLRVSKIVNQNDGLKPFWTPPVVTQLPSQATEGDQVLLYSASPYAGYQTHQYVTGSWRTLDDSRGTGAWQSWTPTVAQGATNNIAKTVQYAKYVVLGKTVIANCRLDLTANGTAGSQASISIPSEIATASTNPRVGACHIYDASTTVRYTGQAEFLTSTTLGFVGDWSGNNAWGAAPNLALGTSDQIGFSIMYEIA